MSKTYLVKHYILGVHSDILAITKDCINFFEWNTLGFLDEGYLREATHVLAFGHCSTQVQYLPIEYA